MSLHLKCDMNQIDPEVGLPCHIYLYETKMNDFVLKDSICYFLDYRSSIFSVENLEKSIEKYYL